MIARNNVKRPSDQSLDARLVLAAAQLRLAAQVEFLVARWLEALRHERRGRTTVVQDRSEAHA